VVGSVLRWPFQNSGHNSRRTMEEPKALNDPEIMGSTAVQGYSKSEFSSSLSTSHGANMMLLLLSLGSGVVVVDGLDWLSALTFAP